MPRELPEETLRNARRPAKLRQWIAQQLAGGLRPQDVMVLSRKRDRPGWSLQDELRALHIPAQVGEKTELIECC